MRCLRDILGEVDWDDHTDNLYICCRLSGDIISVLPYLWPNKPVLLKISLESDVPKPYIEDFLSNFRWVWWLEEDKIRRSMVEEIRETSELLSILPIHLLSFIWRHNISTSLFMAE
jgi:hypothetical protein